MAEMEEDGGEEDDDAVEGRSEGVGAVASG